MRWKGLRIVLRNILNQIRIRILQIRKTDFELHAGMTHHPLHLTDLEIKQGYVSGSLDMKY